VWEVKIPLDHICVKTGVLCPRCQRLVDTGAVQRFEIDVMRALLEVESRVDFRFLKDASYVKSFNIDNVLVLLIELRESNIHSRTLAKLGRALAEKLGRRVRVVNVAHGNLRDIASQLIYPARVIGVNTLWLPDGTIEHIVRIPRSDRRYLPLNTLIIENILSQITGMNVRIRVEG